MSAKIFTWDWKEQPPLADIAVEVTRLSKIGEVHLHAVDTESDEYALVISDRQLTAEQVQGFYEDDERLVRVEVIIEPHWTIDNHTETIEIDAGELLGLEGAVRQDRIIDIASAYVNDVCSWGAQELGPGGKPVED